MSYFKFKSIKNKNTQSKINSTYGNSLVTTDTNDSTLSVLEPNWYFYEFELGEVLDVINSDTHPLFNEQLNNIGYVVFRYIHSNFKQEDITYTAKPYNKNGLNCIPLKHELILIGEYPSLILNNINENDFGKLNISEKKYYYLNTFSSFNSFNNIDENIVENISLNIYSNSKLNENNQYRYNIKEGDISLIGRNKNLLNFDYEIGSFNLLNNINTNDLTEWNDIKTIISATNKVGNLKILNNNFITNNFQDYIDFNNSSFESLWLISEDIKIISSIENLQLISSNKLFLSSNDNISLNTKKDIIMNFEGKTYIGDNAKQQAIRGNDLYDILSELIDEIKKIIVLTRSGQSGTPINNPKFSIIKNKMKKILSKKIFLD